MSGSLPVLRRGATRNRVKLLQSGPDFFRELERQIQSARHEIHIQTYIFEDDETGLPIIHALLDAAGRGVNVYVLVDAYGSKHLRDRWSSVFRKTGLHFNTFGPLFSKGRFHIGRRLHRKVVTIDGQVAFAGGMNISNHYNDRPNRKAWLDFTLMTEGPVAHRLELICRRSWKVKFKRHSVHDHHSSLPHPYADALHAVSKPLQNDFLRRKSEITTLYRQTLRTCSERIVIVGGYFLPGRKVRHLLQKAAQRGVRIDVVMAHQSDVRISLLAREYLYRWMFRYGISIYEYEPAPVHGKLLWSDGQWVSVGSFDLNPLSMYSNIELNLTVWDESFAAKTIEHLDTIMTQSCRRLDVIEFRSRFSVIRQLKCWVAYRITKFLFGLAHSLSARPNS